MSDKSLYERLGGYEAIAAVTDALMVRIKDDDKLRPPDRDSGGL